jgi:type I restriction enzyme, S subunit
MDMMVEQFKTIFNRPEKVKKLREMILDLAVRGKLVEQDPNDEPASVLLERIKEEKERLIKEKKIKKEKPLVEISEEEKPFKLPNGWEWKQISYISSLIGDGLHGTPVYNSYGEYYFINGNNLLDNKINIKSNTKRVSFQEYNKYKKELNNTSVLISINGTLGNVGFYNSEKVVLGKSAAFINLINGVEREYFSIVIRSTYMKMIFCSRATGSTIKNLGLKVLRESIIPIPPYEEQKRIVEKVDSLMAFCDELEEALEKKSHYGELAAKSVFNAIGNVSTVEELEETLRFILLNFKDLSLGDNAVKELKNCILQLAVQGKLVPQDPNDEPAEVLLEKIREEKERLIKEKKIKKEKPLAEISEEEKLFELPSGWKWVRLKEIGYNLGQKKPDTLFTYIDVGTINKEKGEIGEQLTVLNPENAPSRARKLVDKGTVIYSTVRPYLLNIAIVDKEFEFEPIVSTAFALIHPYNGMNNRFILYYLRSVPFVKYVESQMVGMAYPAINDEKLFSGLFPIPPSEEQRRIVEKVDSLMKLCDELENKIQKQKDYSNRLMECILKSSF